MTSASAIQREFRLVAVAVFAAMAAMRCTDPMLGTLADEFARSVGTASGVVSSFAISYGVLQLVYGPLGDRLGKLRVISLAAAACSGAAILAALAWSIDALIFARALMGATAAGIVPLSMAWIGDRFDYMHRQETLARLLGATVSGMIAGQVIGAWLTQFLGWRTVFGVLTVLFAVSAWPLWRTARSEHHSPATKSKKVDHGFRDLLAMPRVRSILLFAGVEGSLMFGVLAFAPSFLTQRYGFGTAIAGAVIALFGLGGFIYSRLARRLLSRLGERGLAAGGGLMVGASLVALVVIRFPEAAVLACLTAGVGFYMLHGTLQTRATQMAPARRGTAVAWFACSLFLGQSVGIHAFSFAVDGGLLAEAIGLCGVGLAMLGVIVSRAPQPSIEAMPSPK